VNKARPTTAIINKSQISRRQPDRARSLPGDRGQNQRIQPRTEAAYKKRAQDTYAAHLRTLEDEKSTKQFYQSFKAKHASGDIPELVVTPDWDNPDAKFGTVDITPLILKEFRNYYS
jgi:hypothetical protein